MYGGQEKNLIMGQPLDAEHMISSVAIGNNTFARSGSVMIGAHNYKGKMGDMDVDTANTRSLALNMYANTIGSNSFANGVFSNITGSYSIMTSDYDGGRWSEFFGNVKNFGAVINGSFNSIESKSSNNYTAGVANAIVGVANKTNNSNGSIILGAGNQITNSVKTIPASSIIKAKKGSANDFAEALRETIQNGEGAGGMGIIGGGNIADWATKSQIIGISNTLKGEENKVSDLNYIMGYKNTADKAKHTYIIGVENKLTDSQNNIVIGDKTELSKGSKNVILGYENKVKEEAKDVVTLGNDIKANTDNSVYLGSKSTEADAAATVGNGEYKNDTAGWQDGFEKFAGKTADGIVSVGSKDHERRIQNVAAGLVTETSTDAINGSQLYWAIKNVADSQPSNPNAGNINYKANGGAVKSVSLESGLDFTNTENITASVEDNGVVKMTLNDNLVNINKVQSNDSLVLETKNKSSITLGDNIAVNNKKITGIAAGDVSANSTDAINGSQLYDVSNSLNDLRDETRSGFAMGAALASLKPLQYRPLEKTQIMAGIGRYKSKNAYALGLAVHSNEDLLWNGGIAFGKGNTLLINAGVTWRVGTKRNQEVEPPYEKGPISSVKILEDKVTLLEKENVAIRRENINMHQQVEQMMQELKSVQEQMQELLAKQAK